MIGISTANDPMQRDLFVYFARKGYTCVEYNHRFTPFFLSENRLKHLKACMEKYNLTITFHSDANDLCHPDRLVADSQLMLLKSEMWFANRLGIKHIVFHLPKYLDTQEILIDTVLKELCETATGYGVALYLENDSRGPWADPHNVRAILDRHPLRHCLDTGHLNNAINAGITDMDTHFKLLGERMDYLHLHDNDGKSDQHIGLGKGNIDLKYLFSKIDNVEPSILIIETHDMKDAAITRDMLSSFGYD